MDKENLKDDKRYPAAAEEKPVKKKAKKKDKPLKTNETPTQKKTGK